jgi:hypothetical protein
VTEDVHDGSLLLGCLGIGEAGRRPALTASEWAEVLRQAGENNLVPLLYHRLCILDPTPQLPPGALEHLREATLASAARSLQISRALGQILGALGRGGIPVIVLKGGYLAQVVYESPALRTMGDLDVLVQREDLDRTAAVLAGMGYAPLYEGVEEVDYTRHHHLRPLAGPEGVRVEIHWNIVRPTPAVDVDLDGLWGRARGFRLAGVEAQALAPEDLLLHLCLHASFSHKFRVGLRACWDILEVTRRHADTIDWEELVRRARQWRVDRYVYLTLRLVRELLGADIPQEATTALEPPGFPPQAIAWARTCIFLPDSDVALSPSMASLWTARRLGSKLGLLLNILFPQRAALARMYRRRSDSAAVYLLYPRRWTELLVRYARDAHALHRGDPRKHNELRAVAERTALRDWLQRSG